MDFRPWVLDIFDGIPEEKYYAEKERLEADLQETVELVDKMIRKDEVASYLSNRYPKIKGKKYTGRHFDGKKISIDPRVFLCQFDTQTQGISSKFMGKTDDEKALEALKWIRKNVKYDTDKNVTSYNEHWNFPFETISAKKGDCEDGAILLYNLMLAAGIPRHKMMIRAGWVKIPSDKAGHCYLTYYCEETNKDVILDWCYWYNNLPIAKRKSVKEEKQYLSCWFGFDLKHIYSVTK